MALAAHRRGSELFLERTIPEVLCEKLVAWGLQPDADFASLLRSRYFRREIVAQHEESDLMFFRRLCEGSGITTSYEERGPRGYASGRRALNQLTQRGSASRGAPPRA